ncbi:sigma-70 family RNA polymerase sigma factor [Rubinisphaera margarita]|uniref:sigma-70 family RNA polymerase sigma factor n=1 Tax=Rubinisphaera margarita TaxID=2909586 RepID=UPI001EE91462|nr:sigma-70 family RNA polymerase sigma factor [Rubinisphaera margarita]MCG6158210.1 sigma-70 family RNA polymerase sigma factor [Rubinisphaera margarita]
MTTTVLIPASENEKRGEHAATAMSRDNASTLSDITTNRSSLNELWSQAEPVVKGFLLASLPQSCDADDVLQEVALEVSRRFEDYDPSRPFAPWALWIAKIKTADFFRRTYRDRHLLVGDALEPLAAAACRASLKLQEQSDALEECLKSLSSKNRKLITLRYREGLSPARIADELETSSGTVRVLLHRIRTALGKCIESRLQQEGQK